jgi:hypothetical protein
MDRRTFLTQASVLAALSGVTIRITGCSEDSSTTGTGGNPDVVQGTVGTNHGHAVSISRMQINDGQAVTLTLSSGGDGGGYGYGDAHVHSVSLTADQVVAIGQDTQVQADSTTNGQSSPHFHRVTFN